MIVEDLTYQVGIRIGEFHTWKDFQMYLNEVYLGETVQERFIADVPGLGTIAFDDFLDFPTYKQRTLRFSFDVIDNGFPGHYRISSKIKNAFQGENKKIILDEDSDYYWFGHVSVDTHKKNAVASTVIVTCTVNPYKMKNELTIVKSVISGEAQIICSNEGKSVVPTIIADSDFRVTFEGTSYVVKAGTTLHPDMLFQSGNNILDCYGNGTITFEYRAGSLLCTRYMWMENFCIIPTWKRNYH